MESGTHKVVADNILEAQTHKNYFFLLNFIQLIPQLIKIIISIMCEHNNNILPKASHPKPASAHWLITLLHSSSALQCSHRKIKPVLTRTKKIMNLFTLN